jgi:hypothetical protein
MENGNAELENLRFGIVFFLSPPEFSGLSLRKWTKNGYCVFNSYQLEGIHYYLPLECN